ncbi:DGQHR domain-containing protein [Falsiroseomonas sp. HW251]|uniref:DGQHR domain-containing protein n=1 Tax=Falsiroseomonas sp. HW251 TaxID=3390998 RepID=UPI003D3174DC
MANGWELVRENQNTDRYQKLKPHDEQLENEFWCLAYQMGYEHLSVGRGFQIEVANNKQGTVSKQIDVFAYDSQTVLVVECKSSEKRGKRSLQKDIGDFAVNQKGISNTLRKFFGREFDQKIIWIFVTRNIEWSEPDRTRALENNIRIITERELAYYKELAKRLGPSGRYQFHAEFLEKTKVDALEHKIFALRTKLGAFRAYSFFADPEVVLPSAFVNHRDLRDPSAAPSYQRLIHRPRIKSIAEFLRKGGFFPNSVILNFKRKARFEIIKPEDSSGVAAGELTLPNLYKTAWIIDGQHRLYGYTELPEGEKGPKLPFIAFENIPIAEETRIFADINSKQKSVQKKLLDEITGEIKLESTDKKDQLRAIASRAFDLMRDNDTGPFADKIAGVELKRSDESIITIPYLVDAVLQAGLLGRVSNANGSLIFNQGPLSWSGPRDAVPNLSELIESYFDLFRAANPQRWDQGKAARFPTNVGAAGLIRLAADVITFMAQKEHEDPRDLHPKVIVERIEKYVEPCVAYFKAASDEELTARFSVPFGSGGPRIFQHRLRELVRSKYPDFSPAGFAEDLRKYDADRRRDADQKVRAIQESVHRFVIHKLREVYPSNDDDYLRKAVENKEILKKAFEKQLEADEKDRKDLGTYLDFIDLRKIVETPKNWEHFKTALSIQLPGEQKGRAKYVTWFDQVNKLRRVSAHPYNRGYDDEEINMLIAAYQGLIERGVITK